MENETFVPIVDSEVLKRLKKRIKKIPPSKQGWWKGGDDAFLDHAKTLWDVGMSEDSIIETLTKLYRAVADEYGD